MLEKKFKMTGSGVLFGSSTTWEKKVCECYSSPSTDCIIKCTRKKALLKLGYTAWRMNRAEDSILILATILLVVAILTISDFPTMFLISMTTCVDQWTDKVQRVVSGVLSVLMALIGFAVFSIRYSMIVPIALVYGTEYLSICLWSLFQLLSNYTFPY